MSLELNKEEAELSGVLADYGGNLRMEISNTGSHDFREGLKRRQRAPHDDPGSSWPPHRATKRQSRYRLAVRCGIPLTGRDVAWGTDVFSDQLRLVLFGAAHFGLAFERSPAAIAT